VKFRLAATAIAATTVLALAGCSSAEPAVSPSPDPSSAAAPADVALLESFEWSEAENGQPLLTFAAPATVTGSVAVLVEDGDGAAIVEGMQLVLDYVVFQGSDGAPAYSTYDIGQGENLAFSSVQVDPVLYAALDGAHVGADIIYGIQDVQAGDGSSVFLAMTVTSGTEVLGQAEGTTVEPVAGLPEITLDATGKPSVDFTGAVESSALVSQLLIEGEGELVEVGDSLTVHYTGWLWDGEQFDSSWDRGAPSTFGLVSGGLIEGWVQGLDGVPVGSQVLLVIPADLGYGAEGSNGIPGGATLVFVIDVLAAV
jgi:peptidylprolyl isomerase